MATDRIEIAITDNHADINEQAAAGTVAVGHIIRIDYDDTQTPADMRAQLQMAIERITELLE